MDLPIELRTMTLDDYDAVRALVPASGAEAGPGLPREAAARLLTHNPATCLVALGEGFASDGPDRGIVGAVMAAHDGWRGTIYLLSVAPGLAGRGIERRLAQAVCEALAAEGITELASAQAPGSPAGGETARPTASTEAHAAAGGPTADDSMRAYQQAASAFLDTAELVGRFVPVTRAGRAVNLAMPVARKVVADAPRIAEKAAPVVSKVAERAPEMTERAAVSIGHGLSKLGRLAKKAAGDVADGARRAAEEYRRERDR